DFDAVNRADVRMIERGQDLRLALEPRGALRVPGDQIGQDFDRDRSVQAGVAGLVNLAHAAGANCRDNFVGADTGAGGKRHGEGAGILLLVALELGPWALGLSRLNEVPRPGPHLIRTAADLDLEVVPALG